MIKGAELSECRTYRYKLWRTWDEGKPVAMFIMLNPSTADENDDDRTIRRCIGFAKSWGYGSLVVCNLFAFRSKNPKEMKAAKNPYGPRNLDFLLSTAKNAGVIVCAWGDHGRYRNQSEEIRKILTLEGFQLTALILTKAGQPGHPLYLKKTLTPHPYNYPLKANQ